MEMHQVRYFLAAARTSSFTRAAELCHVSQPALTTAIRRLEEQLGSKLFHREGRGPSLTEFGRRMQPHLAQIVEQAEAAENVAKDFRLLKDVPVRTGVMATIGPVRLAAVVSAFERGCSGVEVAVHEGMPEALAARLDADELDFAILNPLDGLGDNFRAEPLYAERYMVALPAGHRLSERKAIALADLSGEAYVDRLSCEMREMVMATCQAAGVELYARFRSGREDWVQAMVAAGVGFAFMPEFSITDRRMIRRPLIEPEVVRTIALVTVPGRRHTPALAAFVRAVRTHRWPRGMAAL